MAAVDSAQWLTDEQETRWMAVSSSAPILSIAYFSFACWTCACGAWGRAAVGGVSRGEAHNAYGRNLFLLVHGLASVAAGAWLMWAGAAAACGGRAFCFHPYAGFAVDALTGFYAFDAAFSRAKCGGWLLPLGAAEDVLWGLVCMLQRVYPCAAVVQLLPWWLTTGVAQAAWAAEALLDAGGAPWSALFIAEMVRGTTALYKFLMAAVLAYSTSRWLWDEQLTALALPHGLGRWSWYYSYGVSASLTLMAFVAFRQLRGAVQLSEAKIQKYRAAVERARRRAEGGGGDEARAGSEPARDLTWQDRHNRKRREARAKQR